MLSLTCRRLLGEFNVDDFRFLREENGEESSSVMYIWRSDVGDEVTLAGGVQLQVGAVRARGEVLAVFRPWPGN